MDFNNAKMLDFNPDEEEEPDYSGYYLEYDEPRKSDPEYPSDYDDLLDTPKWSDLYERLKWQIYGTAQICDYVYEGRAEMEWPERDLQEDESNRRLQSRRSLLPQMQPYRSCAGTSAFVRNIVFTDGSYCSRKNKSGYGIFMGLGHALNRAVTLDEPHSSARAEIQGILQSLLLLLKWEDRPKTEINIYTDCLFCILALYHVRARRTRKREPEMNRRYKEKLSLFLQSLNEELNILLSLAHRFEHGVSILFMRSHCGEYGNERADLYATIGRIGVVDAAQRLKSWTDCQRDSARTTPRDVISNLSKRPYIDIRPSQAEMNMSRLTLDPDDRNNQILYPRQQIVWNPDHWLREESIGTIYD